MKKKSFKEYEKHQKAKAILKWVAVGVGWTALLGCFIGLLCLGVKGCNNKKSKMDDNIGVTTTPLKAHNVVQPVDYSNGYFNNLQGISENGLQNVAGYTQEGTSSLQHYWTSADTYAPWLGAAMPAFNLELTNNTSMYRLFTLKLDGEDGMQQYNVYRVTQPDTNDGVLYFYYYNNGTYGNIQIDDRDFEYDTYTSVSITFPAYNYDWVMTSNDYVVNASFVYFNYSSTYWLLPDNYKVGSFYEMFRLKNDYVNQNYGWAGRQQVIAQNEAGGNTSGSGSVSGSDNALYGVFSLLSMAFSAIASIMAISIIPGVTLGTLIVIPLVLTIIMLIVHLFKR